MQGRIDCLLVLMGEFRLEKFFPGWDGFDWSRQTSRLARLCSCRLVALREQGISLGLGGFEDPSFQPAAV